MSVKILKLVSEQTAPFNPSLNKVDIKLPQNLGAVDLSRTCIMLNVRLKDSSSGDLLGLQDASFQEGLDARCLIKNCTISSDKHGVLEQISAANVLWANLDQVENDFEDLNSKRYYGYSTSDNKGYFIEQVKNGDGAVQSKQKTNLRIPLSHLFGIAKIKQFPLNLAGNCTIHLEFEDDTIQIVPLLFKKVTSGKIDLGTGQSTSATNKNIVIARRTPEELNYYIGQPVTVKASNANVQTKINAMAYDGTNVTITVNDAVVFNANAGENLITGKDSTVINTDLTYEVMDVELEVYQYQLNSNQQGNLSNKVRKGINMNFITYGLERVNMPTVAASSVYDRQFDLEPNTINVLGMMPITNSNPVTNKANPFYARFDNIKSYRWKLNGIDTTDRDVVPLQSLYNDRLISTLSSGFLKVKNLRLNNGLGPASLGYTAASTDRDPESNMIVQPIPLNQGPQILQLRINQGASAMSANKIFHLYKQVQKSIKISSAGITVN